MKRLALVMAMGLFVGQEARAEAVAEVSVELSPAATTVGQVSKLEIQFKVPPGSHISPEAPLAIRLTAPKAVRLDRKVLHYKDTVAPAPSAPRFVDRVTAEEPGDQEIDLKMSYYVCTKDLCNLQKQTRSVRLSVK